MVCLSQWSKKECHRGWFLGGRSVMDVGCHPSPGRRALCLTLRLRLPENFALPCLQGFPAPKGGGWRSRKRSHLCLCLFVQRSRRQVRQRCCAQRQLSELQCSIQLPSMTCFPVAHARLDGKHKPGVLVCGCSYIDTTNTSAVTNETKLARQCQCTMS